MNNLYYAIIGLTASFYLLAMQQEQKGGRHSSHIRHHSAPTPVPLPNQQQKILLEEYNRFNELLIDQDKQLHLETQSGAQAALYGRIVKIKERIHKLAVQIQSS